MMSQPAALHPAAGEGSPLMEMRHPPPPPDHRPARWVEALYQQWIDPVEVAFDDLAAQQALEELRARLARRAAPPQPAVNEPG